MKITSANIAAFIVGIIALIGAVVLIALHDVVPGYVWAIAIAALTGGAGLSVPAGAAPTVNALLPQAFSVDLKQLAVEVLNHLSASTTTTTAAPATTAATGLVFAPPAVSIAPLPTAPPAATSP